VSIGFSTATEWWGPGLRNTLLLSTNAPGIPRVFIRTRNAQLTKIGKVEASAFIGVLTESRFFDTVSTNNYRAISGIRATLRPAFDSTMTLGIARLSMTPVARPAEAGRHALDALTIWEPLASPGDTLDNGSTRQRNDQLLELFVRFHFPESGFQAYAELARMENPRSLGEWLVAPHSTQGWLMGLEWLGDPLWATGGCGCIRSSATWSRHRPFPIARRPISTRGARRSTGGRRGDRFSVSARGRGVRSSTSVSTRSSRGGAQDGSLDASAGRTTRCTASRKRGSRSTT
jgi:hypothetical protein